EIDADNVENFDAEIIIGHSDLLAEQITREYLVVELLLVFVRWAMEFHRDWPSQQIDIKRIKLSVVDLKNDLRILQKADVRKKDQMWTGWTCRNLCRRSCLYQSTDRAHRSQTPDEQNTRTQWCRR